MYLMWFAIKMIYHRAKRFIWMPRCHLPQKGFLISHAYALTKRKDTFTFTVTVTHPLMHSHNKRWCNEDYIEERNFFSGFKFIAPKYSTSKNSAHKCQMSIMMIHWLLRKQTKKWKLWHLSLRWDMGIKAQHLGPLTSCVTNWMLWDTFANQCSDICPMSNRIIFLCVVMPVARSPYERTLAVILYD